MANTTPEREAELRAWLKRFEADPKNATLPSWTQDLLAMLDVSRAETQKLQHDLSEEQQRGSNACLEWSDALTETVQCLADACPLGWIAAQDMDDAQAWEKRAVALVVKHGVKESAVAVPTTASVVETPLTEPCGVYGCTIPKLKGRIFCDDCSREYRDDPDAFK